MAALFHGMMQNKKYVITSSILCLLFWLLQYAYQAPTPEQIPGQALVRSFAFTATTLIGLALLIGPIAKLTRYNFVVHRRTVGVWGFTFGLMHVLAVLAYYFGWNVLQTVTELNPFINPIVFGILSFVVFIPTYLTSTDWAIEKLTPKRWLFIHRFVYIAFTFLVVHFLLINQLALMTPPGYVLVWITTLVYLTEFLAFLKISIKRRGINTIMGVLITVFVLNMFYHAWFVQKHDARIGAWIAATLVVLMVVVLIAARVKKRQHK